MAGGLSLLVVLVLSSCMLVGGQNCLISVTQFHFHTVTVSAERVGGSTPGARVTWNTTVPPECVTSVRVEFRTSNSHGPAVANYTTTNTSLTGVVQTGLQCATSYFIRVLVTGNIRQPGGMTDTPMLSSRSDVQSFVGDIPVPVGVRAEATADNTSIRVSWQWSPQGVPMCVDLVRVDYQPEGGSLMMYTVDTTTATSATLHSLKCNTKYTIWVHARGGPNNTRSVPRMVNLPARAPPTPTNVTAQFMNASSLRVTWQWASSGSAPNCFNTTAVTYHPDGGSESSLQLSNPAATEATLTDLQCNTSYTITVVVTAGEHRREGAVRTVLFPQQGPQNLSASVLSPTSIHLTWVASCHIQQYHIYYRGTCGNYVDEGRLDTDRQEYTFDGLQEGTNYSFTVNQTGFSGVSTGPVYARTFTADEPGSFCDSTLDEPQSSSIASVAAVAGVAVTAVLVLLVVAGVQSVVIWHQQRFIATIKSQTQRNKTTEIPLKECSAYGQIDQGGGIEREETYIYEHPQ